MRFEVEGGMVTLKGDPTLATSKIFNQSHDKNLTQGGRGFLVGTESIEEEIRGARPGIEEDGRVFVFLHEVVSQFVVFDTFVDLPP